MSKALIYLLGAGLFVNGMHGYLLYAHRSTRVWSISEHAIKDSRSLLIYRLGHYIGGLFFLLFAKEFLLDRYNSKPLFILACVTVFFEYLQATLPAGGKYNTPHSAAAYIMWLSFIIGAVWSVLTLPLPHQAKLLATPVMAVLVATFIICHFLNRNYVWLMQMSMVVIFFVGLLLMQLS